jgi:hypothetical protein
LVREKKVVKKVLLWFVIVGLFLFPLAACTSVTVSVWKQLPSYGGDVLFLAIDPSNPQTLYAGTGGGVFKSTNGGVSWAASSTGLGSSSAQCLIIDPGNPQTLYAGTGGGVFKSTNGGVSWAASSTGLGSSSAQCLIIDPSNSQTLYAGGGLWKRGVEEQRRRGKLGRFLRLRRWPVDSIELCDCLRRKIRKKSSFRHQPTCNIH